MSYIHTTYRGKQEALGQECAGTQTNLTTGKVRRIQRLQRGAAKPAWEGTGVRRRPAVAGGRSLTVFGSSRTLGIFPTGIYVARHMVFDLLEVKARLQTPR